MCLQSMLGRCETVVGSAMVAVIAIAIAVAVTVKKREKTCQTAGGREGDGGRRKERDGFLVWDDL